MRTTIRKSIHATLLWLMALAFPANLCGQTIVEASIDTASILVGEQVQVKLQCTTNASTAVVFPTYQPTQEIMPGVEVVSNGRTDTLKLNDGKRIQLVRRYTITSFDSALYSLPPFEVMVGGQKMHSRGTVGLKVSTIPVDTVHVDQIKAPKGTLDQPFEWEWTNTLLMLLAWLMAGASMAMWMRFSNPKLITRRVVVRPPTPPHITAVENINQIKQQAEMDQKAYYMQLTDALRTYIEGRFGFSAKEMTTTEIVSRLTSSNDTAALEELKNVLTTADLVKFAKLAPSQNDKDHNLMQALDFVQTTKVVPAKIEAPKVEFVSLSDKKQQRMRMLLLFGALTTMVLAMLLTFWVTQF